MHRRVGFLIAIVVTSIVAVCGFIHAYKQYIANTPPMEPDKEVYPVRGIDISAHNGHIDFDRVKAAGYDFAIIKATEGTDFKDVKFTDNVRRASEAGMKVGAYHFFRFDTDGEMQAVNLLHSLRYRNLDFPVVIDIEQSGNPEGYDPAEIVDKLRAMVSYLENEEIEIMLYSNKDDYNRYLKENFKEYPLWLCSFSVPEDGQEWTVWQYSHRGSVDGINGKVDLNTIKSDFYRLL